MKHIKKFNENKFLPIELIEDVKDILLDLKDNFFEYNIQYYSYEQWIQKDINFNKVESIKISINPFKSNRLDIEILKSTFERIFNTANYYSHISYIIRNNTQKYDRNFIDNNLLNVFERVLKGSHKYSDDFSIFLFNTLSII